MKKQLFCLLFVVFFGQAQCRELYTKEECLFVSLGTNCTPTTFLREMGLRKEAYPFDWLITTTHESLIELFNDDFKFFLKKEYFSPLEPNEFVVARDHNGIAVKNNYYGIYFFHDWPFKDRWRDQARYDEQLHEIKKKFQKRIARFKQLNKFQGKVFFIRTASFYEKDGIPVFTNITPEIALDLKNALGHYFPKLDFTLAILQFFHNPIPEIEGIDRVVTFKMTEIGWEQDFKGAFQNLLDNHRQKKKPRKGPF